MTAIRTQRFVTPDGLTLVADIAGRAGSPAVILLHGGGQTRHSWTRAMHRMAAEGFCAVSYDARGHGESDWSPVGDYSFAAFAADLCAILRQIEQPTALVGASLGGLTSLYATGKFAEADIVALVLVDVTLRPAREGVEKITRFMNANPEGFETLAEAAAAVAAYNPLRAQPANPAGLARNLRPADNGRLYWHWDPRFLETDMIIDAGAVTRRLEEAAARITNPTLLVSGEHSDVVDRQGVAELVRRVPRIELQEISGAGHMVAGDSNEAFNDAIVSFLKRQHR